MTTCIAVVTSPESLDALGMLFLPETALRATRHGWVYRLYAVPEVQRTQEFHDLHGMPIITTHFFETRQEAVAWVEQDVAALAERRAR